MTRPSSPARRTRRTIALLSAAALLTACGSSDDAATDTSSAVAPKVIVTSIEGDDDSALFAAIYARVLEDAGYRVARKDPVTLDRAGVFDALTTGEINLVPDWTRELVAFVYDQPGAPTASTVDPSASTTAPPTTAAPDTTLAGATTTTGPVSANGRSVPEQIVATRAALPDGVAVGEPTIGEDKSSIACTRATMTANANNNFVGLFSLSAAANTIRLGGSAAWMADDEVGYPAFQQFYGGDFEAVLTIEDADLEAAIDADEVDCVAVESLDPIVTRAKLTVLIDDKAMVRGNAAVPLLSASVATDDLVTVLTQVNNALTSNKINQMLNEIATNGTDPVTVANAFLDTAGDLTSSTSVAG